MKKILTAALVLGSFNSFGASFDERAKQQLDFHLSTIGDTSRSERHWQGAASIGMGALMGLGAYLTSTPSYDRAVPIALGVGGGLMVSSGIVALMFPSAFEEIPKAYARIPERTHDEVILKVGRGESYLAHLASKARRNRLYGGSFLLALGAAEIVWYATEPTNNRSYLLYQGIIFAARGILPLIFESESEAQNAAYREWKSGQKLSLKWNIVPLLNGGALYASLQF